MTLNGAAAAFLEHDAFTLAAALAFYVTLYFGAELVGQQLGFHNLTPAVGCIDEAPPRLE
jgi:hypothetical protein